MPYALQSTQLVREEKVLAGGNSGCTERVSEREEAWGRKGQWYSTVQVMIDQAKKCLGFFRCLFWDFRSHTEVKYCVVTIAKKDVILFFGMVAGLSLSTVSVPRLAPRMNQKGVWDLTDC